MEKMSRVYKMVAYGLRYHTINQRLQNSAQKFDGHYDELSKVTAEVKKLTCPKKIDEALRVLEMGNESGSVLRKLVDDYKHFKIHEEPGLIASNMLRDYVLPSTAAITLAVLIGEIAYMKKLKEHCQVVETQLSDVAVLECELSNMEALEGLLPYRADKPLESTVMILLDKLLVMCGHVAYNFMACFLWFRVINL